MEQIISIRQTPEWLERAAHYFSSRWNIEKQLYLDSMNDSLTIDKTLPRWYLMLREDIIIGGFGLIENDFMVRTDLYPWMCALYIEPAERGKQLGEKLLAHSRLEAASSGFDKVYLNTDHVGYYEKYGWNYIGDFAHQSGVDTRVYEVKATLGMMEEMSAYFDTRADIYDHHMINDLGLDEFYEAINTCFEVPVTSLLDLGCGTGLELEKLFERFPDMEVTGIDMSAEMLKKLEEKYDGKSLRLICGSYFDKDFDGLYDVVLSTYSLHHFSEDKKLSLYRKVYNAVETGGIFVFGDYTVSTIERQQELIKANDEKRRKQGIAGDELYHFDTPLTPEMEKQLMKAAGFTSAEVVRQWENMTIIVAGK
jgi:SAM-dependent methyltransferase/GNAT superfamily N-acetyltransferase